MIFAVVLVAACSSDDDTTADASTSASSRATIAPTPAATSASVVIGSTVPASTPVADTTVATTNSPPTHDTTPTSTSTSLEPSASELLTRRLPDADDLGIAPGWAERTLSADLANVPVDELDPFSGLLSCEGGPVVPSDAETWSERRFTGVEPVDDVISVRVVAIVEDQAAAVGRAARLASCDIGNPDVGIERSEVGSESDLVTMTEVFAPATGSLPFPAAVAHAVGRRDGRTVSVTILGLNNGVGFAEQARAHLLTALDAL